MSLLSSSSSTLVSSDGVRKILSFLLWIPVLSLVVVVVDPCGDGGGGGDMENGNGN